MSITKVWTEEDDAALKRLAAEGASAREIGDALGRGRNSICGRAWRLGITLSGMKKPGGKPRKVRPRVPKLKLVPRVQLQQTQQPRVVLPLAEALPVEAAFIPPSPVTWEGLHEGCCKWPVGDLFCGEAAMPRKPYCERHAGMGTQALSRPREVRRPVSRQRYW